ncbi:hypothetical protein [Streptomyces endophytica]|uniref:Uncharacterized protein n=1 Tax=Streptomyces endophytica TaxID=2991496 RepID=A0ABY6PH99_9ACTN|nr:hypothetical protein [Streptomyces endophytica]UZJ33184.1 hypothetical protein OJ254_26515 [Streptomyces endophytica]
MLRQEVSARRSGVAGGGSAPVPGPPPSSAGPPSAPSRLLTWLARLGVPAAAFAVFQTLVGILPQNLAGEAARYCLAATAGVGVGAVVWLSAALVRTRAAAAAGAGCRRRGRWPRRRVRCRS